VKAVRLTAIGSPLEEQEVPVPRPAPGEALVRVRAAGICHSDVHYRAGTSPVGPLPITPGHEVAGEVAALGAGAAGLREGDRVCLHYLATCGQCEYCLRGQEHFCRQGAMMGKHRDGGFAEYVLMPARSLVPLPEEIGFDAGAVMMCSSATSLHALRVGRLQAGETVAVFGAGGLGLSAVQLAGALGALDVYAIDIDGERLLLAQGYGATPVNALGGDPVQALRELTSGRGVDVALEVIGLPLTMRQAVRSLAPMGRAVLVGITDRPLELDSYRELIGREAAVMGSSDHLRSELDLLLEFARRGRLDLSAVITESVLLAAAPINQALDRLEQYGSGVRTVIHP